MEDKKSAEMSSLLSEDDESLEEEEEEEESTFHREIILQDNYSDEEGSDIQVDTDEQVDPQTQDAEEPDEQVPSDKEEKTPPVTEKRVTFAPEVNKLASNFVPIDNRGPKQVQFAIPRNTFPSQSFASGAGTQAPKLSLLNILPSSILGSAVAMSKYLSEYVAGHPVMSQRIMAIQNPTRRKEVGEDIFPESALTRRFRSLDNTQVSIESAAAMAAKYPYPPGALIQLMHDVFVSLPTNAAMTRLGIFYVYNHLIHKFGKSSWKHPISFLDTGLNRFCIPALMHSNRIRCTNAVNMLACINVWRQRQLYDAETCDRLESLLTCDNLRIGNAARTHTDSNRYTVNSEIGGMKTLKYILKMPMVDKCFKEAIKDCDYAKMIDTGAPDRRQALADAKAKGKYPAFERANRATGQEVILLHSSYLDLAALIEEGDKQLKLIQREMRSIKKKIETVENYAKES